MGRSGQGKRDSFVQDSIFGYGAGILGASCEGGGLGSPRTGGCHPGSRFVSHSVPHLEYNTVLEWSRAHPDYLDQEIFEELENGWRGFTNDTPLVLQLPNRSVLKYFSEGSDSITYDVKDHLSLRVHLIPFWPIRLIPMGTAAKPRSTAKRITSDLSVPYEPARVLFSN
jgi:hypothetical protein